MTNHPISVLRRLVRAILAGWLLLATAAVAAPVKPDHEPPERVDALMVGDRLIDVAYNLGVIPRVMSFRCDVWPFGRVIAQTAARFIGCPHYIVKMNPQIVPDTLRKMNIKRVLIERSAQFDPENPSRDPMNLVPLLERDGVAQGLGVTVEIVDFSGGVEAAVLQLGRLLDREARAAVLLEQRHRVLAEVKERAPRSLAGKRVIVLEGVYQPDTAKAFVRVELPGGVSDRFLLEPLGLINAGSGFAQGEKAGGGFSMVRSLAPLLRIDPDMLILTGDADAVQRLLARETLRDHALKSVKALVSGAVFALPAYKDSGVIEYPQTLRRWASALASP